MEEKTNQHFPFTFQGAKDDPVVYAKLKELTSPQSKPASTTSKDYFPPPESKGGWRHAQRPGFDPTARRHGPRQADEAPRLAPPVG